MKFQLMKERRIFFLIECFKYRQLIVDIDSTQQLIKQYRSLSWLQSFSQCVKNGHWTLRNLAMHRVRFFGFLFVKFCYFLFIFPNLPIDFSWNKNRFQKLHQKIDKQIKIMIKVFRLFKSGRIFPRSDIKFEFNTSENHENQSAVSNWLFGLTP